MEQWEYLTRFIEADTRQNDPAAYLSDLESDNIPIYSPEAMMPELNRLGAKGWELVHMQPVHIGNNYDVLMHEGGGTRRWTNKYFCIFKRRI
jgi:hypothetical protein